MELHYSNTGSTIQLISTVTTLKSGTDKTVLSKVILVSGGNYTFKITNIDTAGHAIMLDSLVLLQDYEGVALHRNSDHIVKDLIANCWNESSNSMTFGVTEECKDVLFSTNTEIYNGAQGKQISFIETRNSLIS